MEKIDVERPLPHGMAASLAGWSARAHQYPVFSPTWFAYRMRSYRAPMIMLALILALVMAVVKIPRAGIDAVRFWATFPAVWLVIALALGLGRWLAVLVVRRNWQPRREAAGIICALLDGVLIAMALTPFVRTGGTPVQGRSLTAQKAREIGNDPDQFWQIRRGTLVCARAIARVRRDDSGNYTVELRGHAALLKVGQTYAWRFRSEVLKGQV